MTQNTLSDEIKRIKEIYELMGLPPDVIGAILAHVRFVAEKTVEAVRVEKEANLGYYGYKTSEQYGKVLGRNETVHELETKASRWLGKEEV